MTDKFIFLDIDGVLNSARSVIAFGECPWIDEPENWDKFFDPVALGMMKQLVKDTNASVVLSSSWRQGATDEQLNTLSDFFGYPFHSCTGYIGDNYLRRGREIEEWFTVHGRELYDTTYCIIDDARDFMEYQKDKLIHVDGREGLSMENWYDAITMLNGQSC